MALTVGSTVLFNNGTARGPNPPPNVGFILAVNTDGTCDVSLIYGTTMFLKASVSENDSLVPQTFRVVVPAAA